MPAAMAPVAVATFNTLDYEPNFQSSYSWWSSRAPSSSPTCVQQFEHHCRPFYVAGFNVDNIVEAPVVRSAGSVPSGAVSGADMVRDTVQTAARAGLNVMRTWAHTTDPAWPLQVRAIPHNCRQAVQPLASWVGQDSHLHSTWLAWQALVSEQLEHAVEGRLLTQLPAPSAHCECQALHGDVYEWLRDGSHTVFTMVHSAFALVDMQCLH